MSTVKRPISTSGGLLRPPAAVTTVAVSAHHNQPFDFRSIRFCDDAQTLARATGPSLQRCRQELFIAEGDVALAHELLTAGYGMEPATRTLH